MARKRQARQPERSPPQVGGLRGDRRDRFRCEAAEVRGLAWPDATNRNSAYVRVCRPLESPVLLASFLLFQAGAFPRQSGRAHARSSRSWLRCRRLALPAQAPPVRPFEFAPRTVMSRLSGLAEALQRLSPEGLRRLQVVAGQRGPAVVQQQLGAEEPPVAGLAVRPRPLHSRFRIATRRRRPFAASRHVE